MRGRSAAADDIEVLLAMDMPAPEWRLELQEKIRLLRRTAGETRSP
jgi:hypothetical protein